MTDKKPRTFEEKVNAILKYYEYTHSWSYNKQDFLPKFAYLADDELESLLQLGREIEEYAREVVKGIFPDYDYKQYGSRAPTVKAAILDKYPYLDADRVDRLTARAIYYVVA